MNFFPFALSLSKGSDARRQVAKTLRLISRRTDTDALHPYRIYGTPRRVIYGHSTGHSTSEEGVDGFEKIIERFKAGELSLPPNTHVL